jgi:sigma-B regulation protein RsbU (phosphoserine phosphatase)
MFPGVAYEEGAFRLQTGDVAVLYSDGVTEALNGAEQEYELSRLVPLVASHTTLPAPALVDTILADVDRFVAGAPQYDDITLMVVRRL